MKNKLLNYFFDSKEEFEAHKPYIIVISTLFIVWIIQSIMFALI